MEVIVVGLSHRTAPVEVRERVAVTPGTLPRALGRLREHVAEGLILSTCNRTEVYGVVEEPAAGRQALEDFMGNQWGERPQELAPYLYCYTGRPAAQHLCAVAAGTDSMILGEPQILGQVRYAYDVALREGAVGRHLAALCRQAIAAGKRARTETAIGRHAVSISSAAVELARRIFGDLRPQQALLVGAGKMGDLTLQQLRSVGVSRVSVVNRTVERARRRAAGFGGEAYGLDGLGAALAAADIAICSTEATEFVVRPETVGAAMDSRPHRPLVLVDIAVPRDVDPRVKRFENVFLYDIDDLEVVCAANLAQRERELERVAVIVDEEAARFQQWFQGQAAVPTITLLRRHAEQIREAELRRTIRRLRHLGEEEQQAIAAMSAAMVNKLLHQPIAALKAANGGSPRVDRAVRELFGLGQGAGWRVQGGGDGDEAEGDEGGGGGA
ncbi:MAG: glutamyl-tRNA reductase [Chloroflexi bacterium]|nr:glutamyl-tRNA reductase [Chloroflexota bacterium]